MAHPGDAAAGARFRTSRIIHGAMVGALLVYAGVVHVLHNAGWTGTAPDAVAAVRWVFYALGGAELVAVLALRPRLLSAEALREVGRRSGAEAAFAQLQTRLIVFMALSEGVAIYGLLLFLLGGTLRDFYALWGAGLLGQLVLTPRRGLWDDAGRPGPR